MLKSPASGGHISACTIWSQIIQWWLRRELNSGSHPLTFTFIHVADLFSEVTYIALSHFNQTNDLCDQCSIKSATGISLVYASDFNKKIPHLSGLYPSSSSRKMLLLEYGISELGVMRNLRTVPLVDPRNTTVRFRWGPASVSTTIVFNWYLHSRQIKQETLNKSFLGISQNIQNRWTISLPNNIIHKPQVSVSDLDIFLNSIF